ncbi:hypothetical protein BT96DRAFT_749584, partial [Gymnopus androsaceus JB14]
SPIYAFYHKDPEIKFDRNNKPKYAKFACTLCCEIKKQGLTGTDMASTGQMKQHAEKCWSKETVRAVYESGDVEKARAELQKHGKMRQSKITLGLKKIKTWAESFSTRPPSKEEIQCDRCYRWLQQEGQPDRYIPSKETVSRDVKHLYSKTKEKLAKELQEYEGELPVAIDCWTSPNHQACMSVMV